MSQNEPVRIRQLRKIVEEKTAEEIDGVLVDLFSASAAVNVYDKLNEANRAKMVSLPLVTMINLVFKLLK